MSALVPCVSCKRHIRVDTDACPFCAAVVPEGFARGIIPAANRRLDRLALFTFATALTVGACGGIDDGKASKDDDGGTVQNAHDAGVDVDPGTLAGAYGGPPLDSGLRDARAKDAASPRDAGPDDDGSAIAMYGLPIDAGGFDVNVQPPYGLPPLDGGN
jgi:hypothetical protein